MNTNIALDKLNVTCLPGENVWQAVERRGYLPHEYEIDVWHNANHCEPDPLRDCLGIVTVRARESFYVYAR